MKLLLDAGNSRLKWRLVAADGAPLAAGVSAYDDPGAGMGLALPAPVQIYGACVAGEQARRRLEQFCADRWQLPVQWQTVQAEAAGVRNHYRSATLGIDRWLSVLAAAVWLREQAASHVLAINAGTAITIDVVSAAGDYLGGSIVPGLSLMQAALAQGTAQLPLEPGQVQDFPRTTVDAISTGISDAACGAIERMRARLGVQCPLLISGGDAAALAARLPAPLTTVENLVLDGLQVITS